MMSVTPVAREYLVAIATLASEGQPVIAARIADRLQVSAPTVHQSLRRLVRDGLVAVRERHEIALTPDGRHIADEAIRRQRLSERWLVELLGVDWAEAREAARAMEPAISAPIAARLAAVLGHPVVAATTDDSEGPSGDPIDAVPADRVAPGAVVILERIADAGQDARALLSYLEGQGLRPGARLTVVAVEPWAHTVTLEHGGITTVLGSRVASLLWVRPLSAEERARALTPVPAECPVEERFVAEVTAVESSCPAGHQVGDRFAFAQRTPCGMCAEAFVEIHPRLGEVRDLAARGDGGPVIVACPEHGNVTFQVRMAAP
jgi:DtxR family Mn-dependent transcriptional regulator